MPALPLPPVGPRGRRARIHEPRLARAGAREADGDPDSRRCRSAWSSTTAPGSTCRRVYGPGDVVGIDPRASSAPTRSRARPTSSRTISPASSSTTPTSPGSSRPRRPARRTAEALARARLPAAERRGRAALQPRAAASAGRRARRRASRLIESSAWARAGRADDRDPARGTLLPSPPDQNLSRLSARGDSSPRRRTSPASSPR